MRWFWRFSIAAWIMGGVLALAVYAAGIVLPNPLEWFAGEVPSALPAHTIPVRAVTPQPRRASVQAEPGQRIFFIAPEASTVSFTIEEVLMGVPTTVVGQTSALEGTILIDLEEPARSLISTVHVDARTLATDNEFRDRSLHSLILETVHDKHRYITFTPKELRGLPDAVDVGAQITFQILGTLQIRGVAHPATFDMTVTPVSPTELRGHGKASVQRADFGLRIPSVPGVANVAEEVTVAIDFIALAAAE